MGSYASITVGGHTIQSTKNYYNEFYFRRSERQVRKRMSPQFNQVDYTVDHDKPQIEVTDYVYVCSVATMRRRLELAGFDRHTLEREFTQCIQERVENLEAWAGWGEEWKKEYEPRLALLCQHTKLDEWLVALKTLVDLGVPSWDWEDLKKDDGLDPVISLLVHADGIDDNFPSLHDTAFPCKTVESMAVAFMEVMSPDVTCELDVTELVSGGWTDSFGDLIEFHQEHTTFYEVFASSLADTRSLLPLAQDNKTLARLLYANVITAMESYLSDTLKKQVINREAIRRRFVQTNDTFKVKINVQDIFSKMETLNSDIAQAIDQMSFHNIAKTKSLYKTVLDTEFPENAVAELVKAVDVRHDIVHRNGKTSQGKAQNIEVSDVQHLMEVVDATVLYIDRQIKDGLLEDDDHGNEEPSATET